MGDTQLLLYEVGRSGARQGGLVAFITSQGMADAERNRPDAGVADGAVRSGRGRAAAGTTSLQTMPERRWAATLSSCKRTPAVRPLSERQRDFIKTRTLSNGITVNNSFRRSTAWCRASAKVGTNPYGKPAMEFTHAGGVEGIARALADMLAEDDGAAFQPGAVRKPCRRPLRVSTRERQTGTVSPRQARRHRTGTEYGAVGQTALRQHGNREIAREIPATERDGIGQEQKAELSGQTVRQQTRQAAAPSVAQAPETTGLYSTTSRRTTPISIRSGRP